MGFVLYLAYILLLELNLVSTTVPTVPGSLGTKRVSALISFSAMNFLISSIATASSRFARVQAASHFLFSDYLCAGCVEFLGGVAVAKKTLVAAVVEF